MSTADAGNILLTVSSLREELDHLVTAHGIEGGMFSVVTMRTPHKLTPAELGFLRTVSWLYVLYFEGGRISVKFLSEMVPDFVPSADQQSRAHMQLVRQLRTYLQHNLAPDKEHDRDIKHNCESWFRTTCSTPIPGADEHWQQSLVAILTEAATFLKVLLMCVRAIEINEYCDDIFRQWRFRRSRTLAPNELDDLISCTAADLGRDNVNVTALRKRYYQKWSKELRLLRGDCDIMIEARKRIELVLMLEISPVLPITGDDVIRELGVKPGSDVRIYLEEARRIFERTRCSRHDLLVQLRESPPQAVLNAQLDADRLEEDGGVE